MSTGESAAAAICPECQGGKHMNCTITVPVGDGPEVRACVCRIAGHGESDGSNNQVAEPVEHELLDLYLAHMDLVSPPVRLLRAVRFQALLDQVRPAVEPSIETLVFTRNHRPVVKSDGLPHGCMCGVNYTEPYHWANHDTHVAGLIDARGRAIGGAA